MKTLSLFKLISTHPKGNSSKPRKETGGEIEDREFWFAASRPHSRMRETGRRPRDVTANVEVDVLCNGHGDL